MTHSITRNAVRNLILGTNGKVFSITFKKKDNSTRQMNARLGVTSHLNGGESTTKDSMKYLDVYDMNNQGYRKINTFTAMSLKVAGIVYKVI